MKTRCSEPVTDLTVRITTTGRSVQQQIDGKKCAKHGGGAVIVHENVAQDQLSTGLQGREDRGQELLIRFHALAVKDIREERQVKTLRQGSGAEVTRDQANAVGKPAGGNQLTCEGQRPGQIKDHRVQLRLNLTKSESIRTGAAAEVKHAPAPFQVKPCGKSWSQTQRIGV